MTNFKELNRCYHLMKQYNAISDSDTERYQFVVSFVQAEVKRLKADTTANKNDGIYGGVFEVLNRSSDDDKIRIQTQNKADAHLLIGKGKKGIELKTNMGRVDFLTDSKTATYVIYQCFLPKQVNGKKTEIPSKIVIMKKSQFKKALANYGKTSKTPDGGHIIRVNKKWFDFINSWELEYDRNKEYTLEMFAPLEHHFK